MGHLSVMHLSAYAAELISDIPGLSVYTSFKTKPHSSETGSVTDVNLWVS